MLTIRDQDKLATWLWERAGSGGSDIPTFCIGKLINGEIVSVIGYNYLFADTSSIYGHIAGDISKNWLHRDFLHAIFAYPFLYLNLDVFFAVTGPFNTRINSFVKKLGFKQVHKTIDNNLYNLYALHRNQCRYIKNPGEIKWVE